MNRFKVLLTAAATSSLGACASTGPTPAERVFTPTGAMMEEQIEISPRRSVAVVKGQVEATHALCAQYGLVGDKVNAARFIAEANPASRNQQPTCEAAGYRAR